MGESKDKLNTIGKAIAVIETIQGMNRPMSIKEIAEHLGINKSSLHHHMKTLTEFGYLQKDEESRKYDIGLGLVRAGQSYLQRLNVRERGHYQLEQLSRKLSETVHMLVLDQTEVVYVDKVDVNHQPGALTCSSYIGHRTDVYTTAAGKVLMAYLERGALENVLNNTEPRPLTDKSITDKQEYMKELVKVREQGYAIDDEEHAPGLQCIAVPVLNLHSQCVAAISVSCPVRNISKEILESEILGQLRETGLLISTNMGYMPRTESTAPSYFSFPKQY